MQTHTEEETAQHQIVERDVSETPEKNREDRALQQFQKTDFYRTIIENNLFRPLGWTPPRPKEPYRLIGTLIPRDDTTPPRAFLQTTTGNITHIVSPGDKIDDHTKVVEIQNKQVTLSTNGKQRTLRLHIRY